MNSNSIRHTLDRILEPILIATLTVLILTVVWQVFSRYVLKSPSTFTDEAARFFLIWLTLLGSAWVTGQRAHLAIDLLIEKLSLLNAIRLQRFISFLIIAFSCSVMVIGGGNLVRITLVLEQTSTVLQVPMGYVYMALPLSGVIIAIYSLCDWFDVGVHHSDKKESK